MAHWSDESHAGSETLRRHRLRRLAILNRVLAPQGLKATEAGQGGFLLQNRTGRSAIVTDLTGLWQAAETLTGHAPDPLNPRFMPPPDEERNPPQ
ncbi:hypothetical protein [Telmatospirillum sp. J64-1]|uniref:hypothetical protein n=1 Tax=Telmatospirillum sp. J64-1 TaxID=2502183 RepID=UPI001C8F80DB|nr:hypothetical protein [Telmatospirillum sp. J64-1]